MPTKEDYAKFKDQFTQKQENYGGRTFKQISEVGKAWKSLKVTVLRKPFVPFFFRNSGVRNTTNLFMIENVLYCYIDNGCSVEIDTPQDFVEIKASEYHKIIEDYEEKLKQKELTQ